MIDVVESALSRAPLHDSVAVALAFASGLSSSVGPCVAPRYFAVVALISAGPVRDRLGRLVSFLGGTVVAYTAIALSGAAVVRIAGMSSLVYYGLAAAFAGFGVYAILRPPPDVCTEKRAHVTSGGGLLLGIVTSLAISPCCTPILVAIGATAGATGSPASALPLIAAFTFGHLLPIAAVLGLGNTLSPVMHRFREAAAMVNGAVLIALGAYYAVLA